jgi:hypothetical protein
MFGREKLGKNVRQAKVLILLCTLSIVILEKRLKS